jgi:hypothetical protein
MWDFRLWSIQACNRFYYSAWCLNKCVSWDGQVSVYDYILILSLLNDSSLGVTRRVPRAIYIPYSYMRTVFMILIVTLALLYCISRIKSTLWVFVGTHTNGLPGDSTPGTPGKPFLRMKCRIMSHQSEAVSALCKPIGAQLWTISEHRETCNSLSDCYLHISKYHLAHRRPSTRFYGACRTYANFFYLIPIFRRFRIIRCKRQAALHSALFNYTPLVIRGTDS